MQRHRTIRIARSSEGTKIEIYERAKLFDHQAYCSIPERRTHSLSYSPFLLESFTSSDRIGCGQAQIWSVGAILVGGVGSCGTSTTKGMTGTADLRSFKLCFFPFCDTDVNDIEIKRHGEVPLFKLAFVLRLFWRSPAPPFYAEATRVRVDHVIPDFHRQIHLS